MELYYYKNREGNFGDDLNPYLWPRLLKGFAEQQPDRLFAGIGTILTDAFFQKYADRSLVVFGSGSRGFYPKAQWPVRSRIAFVRGPLSAAVLGLPASSALTDPAYAINLASWRNGDGSTTKRSGVGFVPHYSTMRRNKLTKCLAADAGLRFIDPTGDVDTVLGELERCEHVICEAMHGAILADALRVPWTRITMEVPFYESDSVNEFKWNDWMLSVRTVSEAVRLPRPPANSRRLHQVTGFLDSGKWRETTAAALVELKDQRRAVLSSDAALDEVTNRISEELERVQSELAV
jgi:succinoglycan biosynthesis protein ExoV